MEINTIEEARAEIIRLTDEVTNLTNQRDTLSQNNESLTQELENVRRLNQEQFNMLRMQRIDQDDEPEDDEPEDVPTCEDFAKTLNII